MTADADLRRLADQLRDAARASIAAQDHLIEWPAKDILALLDDYELMQAELQVLDALPIAERRVAALEEGLRELYGVFPDPDMGPAGRIQMMALNKARALLAPAALPAEHANLPEWKHRLEHEPMGAHYPHTHEPASEANDE